jgi:hypothetical protein
MDSHDTPMFFLMGVCGILLAVSVIGCVGSIKAEVSKQNYLKDNQCLLVSTEETGKRRYCGKACTRPELKKEYSCSNGTTVVIE